MSSAHEALTHARCPHAKGTFGPRHTEKRPHKHGGRGRGDTSASGGTPRVASKPPEAGRAARIRPPQSLGSQAPSTAAGAPPLHMPLYTHLVVAPTESTRHSTAWIPRYLRTGHVSGCWGLTRGWKEEVHCVSVPVTHSLGGEQTPHAYTYGLPVTVGGHPRRHKAKAEAPVWVEVWWLGWGRVSSPGARETEVPAPETQTQGRGFSLRLAGRRARGNSGGCCGEGPGGAVE